MQTIKLLLLAILAFAQLAEFVGANENVGDQYYDQVVYFESVDKRGSWLARGPIPARWGNPNKAAIFENCAERDVIGKPLFKWIVRECPGGAIALENVAHPHHYLGADMISSGCTLVYYTYPQNVDEVLWYLEKRSDGNFELHSKRYYDDNGRVHANWKRGLLDYLLAGLESGTDMWWSALRLYQPPVREERKLVAYYNNLYGNTPVTRTFKERIGISKTTSTSIEISAEVGLEIKSIFSAKLSTTWTQTSSSTWDKEVERTYEVQILPGYIKRIYQLTGYYGPFEVISDRLFFEDAKQK